MVDQIKKRTTFEDPEKNNRPLIIGGVVGFVLILALITYQSISTINKADAAIKSSYKATSPVAYSQTTQQTEVANALEGGQVLLSLNDVQSKKVVRTVYNSNGKKVPLTAFLTTKGNLVVAVSLCEPCKSESFHIQGDKIICNTCGTTWKLDNLQGVSGSCQKYPPDPLEYKVVGDQIQVAEATVVNWKPRN